MIKIEPLTSNNFNKNSLDDYSRKQDVKRVYRMINGEYTLVEQPYIEDWDLERRRQIARNLSGEGYITFLAIQDDRIVGFISLVAKLVGCRMILDMMHVSSECRGHGLGRRLFEIGAGTARENGAEELYISACSSEETIAFYQAMGAKITDCPIRRLAEEEPFDLQMACSL